ncbi:MAG: LysR family transcriptional regulator [Lachnospiraceae bacterium]|nr:LysR family transcriptional regulator [Lachnospiraceae bacterium]
MYTVIMIYNDRPLLYFQALLSEQSISRAAEKLYITQSALSKYLKNIEEEAGVTLVDRSASPLKLTPAGEKFYAYLQESAQFYSRSMAELTQDGKELSRELVIGVTDMESHIVSDTFPAFYNRYPNIQLTLLKDHSEKLSKMLEEGGLDIAILVRSGPDIPQEDQQHEILIRQQRLIVASRSNPLSALAGRNNSMQSPDPLDPKRLNGQTIIVGKPGERNHADMHAMAQRCGIKPSGFLEAQSAEAMVSLTQKNSGVSVLPAFYLRRFLPLYNLVYFYVDLPEFDWAITLEYLSAPPDASARFFAANLRKAYGRR